MTLPSEMATAVLTEEALATEEEETSVVEWCGEEGLCAASERTGEKRDEEGS